MLSFVPVGGHEAVRSAANRPRRVLITKLNLRNLSLLSGSLAALIGDGGVRYAGLRFARRGFLAMKNRAVKSDRKPIVSPRVRPKSRRAETDEPGEPKSPRAPSRSSFMRLAAEVEALAAQLKTSRERIADLEAHVDVDPLTDVLNRRGFERELKRSLAYV